VGKVGLPSALLNVDLLLVILSIKQEHYLVKSNTKKSLNL